MHSLLNEIRNLNLEWISATQIEAKWKDEANTTCSE
jgi:hypothetical protein